MTDRRCLCNELRRLGTHLQVSDTGYLVDADTIEIPEGIQIQFAYDRTNQPVLRSIIDLGHADRHRLPHFMTTSQLLSIGTLALLEENNRAIERLVLVDCRFYGSTSSKAFHHVLHLMADEARRLFEMDFELQPEPNTVSTGNLKRICSYIQHNLRVISINAKVSIRHGRGKSLLSFRLGNGRSQTVLLSLKSVHGVGVVELKSRCRIASTAATVRSALKRNLSSPCGGFALDLTTDPPAVDLIQRLVAVDGEPDYTELLHNLSSIVHRADAIEKTQSDIDEF
ncbi:MAG: hypothetical protein ABGZ35_03305 [Planctomycetaceae bacterium]